MGRWMITLGIFILPPWLALGAEIEKTGEDILDPSALIYSSGSYGVCPNGWCYQQDAITTYGGWQYATWYDSDRRVCVARRKLPAGAWETIRFLDYTHDGNDTHNVTVVGICPADGTVHLSFDHHADRLHYRVSQEDVATRPEDFTWEASRFGPVISQLAPGQEENRVTYPRFLRTPDGGLLFWWRRGSSGAGNSMLAEYSPDQSAWSVLGTVISQNGTYEGSTSRCPYLNGLEFDANGRLHVSWCWRESGDVDTTHDLCYAYSDDLGRTWFNNAGEQAGQTGLAPLRVDTPGITAWPIGMNSNLLNNGGQIVDRQGRVHVVMRRNNDHYWRDLSGTWHKSPVEATGGSRPKLVADDQGNLLLIFRQVGISAATAASQWQDWTVLYNEPGEFFSEPTIDSWRWREQGVLSVLAQTRGQAPGSALFVFDYSQPGSDPEIGMDGDGVAVDAGTDADTLDPDANATADADEYAGSRISGSCSCGGSSRGGLPLVALWALRRRRARSWSEGRSDP